jgi:biopolymer transport protein TolR
MSFGRLERTQGAQPMSDINMTPLVDVMLVLLVIFMVTAPLMSGAIKLNLPRAESVVPDAAVPDSITLEVDAGGQVFMDAQALSADALAARLKLAASDNPDTEIQLRADSTVPYGRVVEIMGAAHAAGLQRIGFVAEPAQAKPESQRIGPPLDLSPAPSAAQQQGAKPAPNVSVIGPARAP